MMLYFRISFWTRWRFFADNDEVMQGVQSKLHHLRIGAIGTMGLHLNGSTGLFTQIFTIYLAVLSVSFTLQCAANMCNSFLTCSVTTDAGICCILHGTRALTIKIKISPERT